MTKNVKIFLGLMLGTPAILVSVAVALAPGNKIIASTIGLTLGLILGFFLAAFAEDKNREETAQAAARDIQAGIEGKIDQKTANTVDIALLNMRKLDEYYNLNKQQARRSFTASIAAVSVGFATIILSMLYAHDANAKFVGGIAGVIGQFIGASFFYLHNKSLNQLNLFYGKLISLQNTMLALQVCEKLTTSKEDAMKIIALELMQRGEAAITNGETNAIRRGRSTPLRPTMKAAAAHVEHAVSSTGVA